MKFLEWSSPLRRYLSLSFVNMWLGYLWEMLSWTSWSVYGKSRNVWLWL